MREGNNSFTTDFTNCVADKSWSFSEISTKETSYITHSYYSYPAKFIPQIVSRLINEYSNKNDLIVDPFMGSGTTIVESIINFRKAIGVDISEIAYLVSKVKSTPINNNSLLKEFTIIEKDLYNRFSNHFEYYSNISKQYIPNNPRIDYWFRENQKIKLGIILKRINEIKDKDIKDFFYVAFAQILKNTSIWLQKSVKPTRDNLKKDINPLQLFISVSKKMIDKNQQFISLINDDIIRNISKFRKLYCLDAFNIPVKNNSVDLIITSPPYVTSYEYADLHQLPSLWFNYLVDINEFRRKFIGSFSRINGSKVDLNSNIAQNIISSFGNLKKALEINNYFADMKQCFIKMKDILKRHKYLCLIIGNTKYKDIDIVNHSVFIEQLKYLGFKIEKVIAREISSKMLPSARDPKTGRFAKTSRRNKVYVHPMEYIIIAKKQ